MPQEAQPRILIYDTVTGRISGGHQADYLVALEAALAEFRPETHAPFRDTSRPIPSIASRILGSVSFFRHALGATEKTLVLVPNPSSLDFVTFAVAAFFALKNGRGSGVFVMRRDAAGIVGTGWRANILDRIVCWLAGGRFFHMVSDTRAAMDHWQARTGQGGAIISIPVRLPTKSRPPGSPLSLGLIGLFRIEKGAAHYDAVIETTRALAPAWRIICQLSHTGRHPEEDRVARNLTAKWGADPMVQIHAEHLDAEAFTDMLHDLDVVVLPYDIQTYGPGTSGILFEALAAGKVVLAAPIAWARQEYRDHPNVVWLNGTDNATLREGLRQALTRAEQRRGETAETHRLPDRFRESWLEALVWISARPQ